jgi:hypothetical protein
LPKAKKILRYKELFIKLYEIESKSIESISNIEAFDNQGNRIWMAEVPKYSCYYYDMQIDEANGEIEADSGTGRIYTLSLKDGSIIRSQIIK